MTLRAVRAAVRLAMLPVVLLVPAGTWAWPEAWILCAIYAAWAITTVVVLARHDPDLLNERMKGSPVQTGQPVWDRVLMIGMLVLGIALIAVPGLDVVRYRWSPALPLWLRSIGLLANIPAFALVGWVMFTNTFLARVVKVDEERGHRVITTGPYAVVRHPMYAGVILAVFAMPVGLGSRWGLVPAALMAAMLVIRTALEDRMLHRSLDGYTAYAAQTRFRILPGVW